MYLPEQFQAFDKLMCNVYQYIFGCSVLFGYKIIHACNLWFSNIPAFFLTVTCKIFKVFRGSMKQIQHQRNLEKTTWLIKVSDGDF